MTENTLITTTNLPVYPYSDKALAEAAKKTVMPYINLISLQTFPTLHTLYTFHTF